MALVIAHNPVQVSGEGSGSASASSFANNGVLGYIVIALLAFCLGVLVTVFCFRMRNHMNETENDDRKL